MTEKKHTPKVTGLRKHTTLYTVDNTVVAKRTIPQYQMDGGDYWRNLKHEEELHRLSGIDSLYFYNYDELTPEGKKMKEEWDAKNNEEDDD